MKNVLIISSSPRKAGNSDTLCDEFMRGAQSVGNRVEKISLREMKINYCSGCGVCNKTKSCTIKDDMAAIIEKMVACDVIVLASPIYFYTMCGQIKTFIDRCCPRYTEISGKQFYYILTAADNSNSALERAVAEFRGFLECLDDPKEMGVVRGIGAWQMGDIKSTEAMRHAYEMGASI